MKKYTNILVLENDPKEVPGHLKNVLSKETVGIEYWFDFRMSFQWDKEKAFGRLMNAGEGTLLVCAPSFAGPDNSFESYMMIFLKLKDMGKKIDIAVIYPDNFYVYLLDFLSDWQNNALKRKSNLEMMKEILDFHNLYEITYSTKFDDGLDKTVHITYDYLMENYFETSNKLGRTECEVIATGEVFECYSIHYRMPLEESEMTLYIESDPNNKYKLKEVKKK